MPNYTRGDVVIVVYPFTDGVGRKARPAVVISSNSLNQISRDLLVAAITSQVTKPPELCDFDLADWQGVNLVGPSRVRVSRIAAVELSKVGRTIGHLREDDLRELERNLRIALDL
jgi:mRNA interferase MazF